MRMAAQCRLLFVLHHFGLCPSEGFPPPFPTVGKGNGGTMPRKARNCNGLRALSVVLSAPTPGPFPGWWRELSYRTAPYPRASVCARGQSPRARQRTRVLHNGGAFYLCRAGADCLAAQIVVARVAVDGPSVFFGDRGVRRAWRCLAPRAARRGVVSGKRAGRKRGGSRAALRPRGAGCAGRPRDGRPRRLRWPARA